MMIMRRHLWKQGTDRNVTLVRFKLLYMHRVFLLVLVIWPLRTMPNVAAMWGTEMDQVGDTCVPSGNALESASSLQMKISRDSRGAGGSGRKGKEPRLVGGIPTPLKKYESQLKIKNF